MTVLSTTPYIEKPLASDVPGIKALIDGAVATGRLLPRSERELQERITELFMFEDDRGVGGCCGLHIDDSTHAELWALVVRDDLRGRGIGHALVDACISAARDAGVAKVYALCKTPSIFFKHGFHQMDRFALQHKVARDCVQCRRHPGCESIAVVRDVDLAALEGCTA